MLGSDRRVRKRGAQPRPARNYQHFRPVRERKMVGTHVEVLCEGPSKTNPARLMGRTRTNKVVVFEAEENRIGKIFDVAIERANGFSLYGQPIDLMPMIYHFSLQTGRASSPGNPLPSRRFRIRHGKIRTRYPGRISAIPRARESCCSQLIWFGASGSSPPWRWANSLPSAARS